MYDFVLSTMFCFLYIPLAEMETVPEQGDQGHLTKTMEEAMRKLRELHHKKPGAVEISNDLEPRSQPT